MCEDYLLRLLSDSECHILFFCHRSKNVRFYLSMTKFHFWRESIRIFPYICNVDMGLIMLPKYLFIESSACHLRNVFYFWNVHGIMNTSGNFARDLKYS